MTTLPDSDHTGRYCKPKHCPGGEIEHSAFVLRANIKGSSQPEPSLSVYWLELITSSSRAEQLLGMVDQIPLQLNRRGRIAILNAGKTKQTVRESHTTTVELTFIHPSREPNPKSAHCGIWGYTFEDKVVVPELIRSTIVESHKPPM